MHALIIANGTVPNPDFVRGLAKFASTIICADGGANHARELGVKPSVIIGDLDSILPSTQTFYHDVEQIQIDDQNSTDLEKAIKYCIDHAITSIDIVGALGTRIDHTTGSLGCFKKFGTQIHIRMIDSEGELTLIRNEVHLDMHKGEKLSLIPLDKCTGISTNNLKYILNNETLELGVRDGISNEAVSENVTIHVDTGTLLLYRFHGEAWHIHSR
ncbi:MAG: thiamine diphosphokinase [Ignavibacteriales bacterium]|nr:thiamine diphosphokinase [Ignavibacteriales bacterium]